MPRMARTLRLLRDAAQFAGVILGGVLSRRSVRPRGDEARRPLPGDDFIPAAKARWTNGITIRATPPDVWPWLAQMGCRRGGWYSYDALDNGGAPSAARIVPSWQSVTVGDVFPWTPIARDGFIVRAVDPARSLVLGGGDSRSRYSVTWSFVLEPIDATRTRLVTRASGDYSRRSTGLFLKVVWHPVHFAMQRRQLRNLKCRVEANTAGRNNG